MTPSIADRLSPEEYAQFMAAVAVDNPARVWDPADDAQPDEEEAGVEQ